MASAVLLAWVRPRSSSALVDRGRPGDLLDDVQIRESGLHGQGYVSGHAAIAFAVATVLTPAAVRAAGGWLPFTLAAVVAFARMYYGAHLPLDVVGGAGLGILVRPGGLDRVRHRRPGPRPLTGPGARSVDACIPRWTRSRP